METSPPDFHEAVRSIISRMYGYQYETIRTASEACVYAIDDIIKTFDPQDMPADLKNANEVILNKLSRDEKSINAYWSAVVIMLTHLYFDVYSLVRIMIASTFDSMSAVLTYEEFRNVVTGYIKRMMQKKLHSKLKPQRGAEPPNPRNGDSYNPAQRPQTAQRNRRENGANFQGRQQGGDRTDTSQTDPENNTVTQETERDTNEWGAIIARIFDIMYLAGTEDPNNTGELMLARPLVIQSIEFLNEKITVFGITKLLGKINDTTEIIKNKYSAKDGTNMEFRTVCAEAISELRTLQTALVLLNQKTNSKNKQNQQQRP